MTWVRIDDGFADHPKICGLSDAAFRLHVHAFCYASRQLTDGFIPVRWLTGGRGKEPKAVQILVDAGLWEATDGGYRIHDYLKYQQSRETVEINRMQLHAVRSEAGRRGGLASQAKQANGKQTASKQDNQLLDKQNKQTPSPIPSPPIPERKETEKNAPPPAPSPLVMSPIDYQKALEYNAFVGSRLLVPKKLHGDFRRDLGGENPEAALMAWYDQVNEEIELSREAILPDVWKWLTARFKTWAGGLAERDLAERYRPKGA